jgi:hypothetical protein
VSNDFTECTAGKSQEAWSSPKEAKMTNNVAEYPRQRQAPVLTFYPSRVSKKGLMWKLLEFFSYNYRDPFTVVCEGRTALVVGSFHATGFKSAQNIADDFTSRNGGRARIVPGHRWLRFREDLYKILDEPVVVAEQGGRDGQR